MFFISIPFIAIMSVYICRQSSPVELELIDITVSLRFKEARKESHPVTVVIKRPDSEERRYAEEDEAAGYSRIEDIKPGKGQEDVDMKDVKENGMTDEEFLNRYSEGLLGSLGDNLFSLMLTVSKFELQQNIAQMPHSKIIHY